MGLLGKENRPVHAGGPERILRASTAWLAGVLIAAVLSAAAFIGAPSTALASEGGNNADSVELAAALIDTVQLTGVEPAVGVKPAKLESAHPWAYNVESMFWLDHSENRFLTASDTFIAGNDYTLTVTLIPEAGFAFKTDAGNDNAPALNTATIFGKEAKVGKVGNENARDIIQLEYSFEVAQAKVSSVAVLGLDEPVAGANPDYEASVESPSLYCFAPVGYAMSGMWWYDPDASLLEATDEFEAGETYHLEIKLIPAMSGYFPQSEFVYPLTATVNGKNVLPDNIWVNDNEVYLYIDYEIEGKAETTPPFSDLWETFPDVAAEVKKAGGPEKVWYVADGWLDYVVQNTLMGGYSSNGYFGPRDKLTRGQVATMLYRAELVENPLYYYSYGSTTDPTAYATSSTFTDVKGKRYYTAAINWAKDAGIMTGDASTNYQTVRPEAPITRQELATMLCRYATSKHVNTITNFNLAGYSDADKVKNWAKPSVAWAVEHGIMGGASKLNPTGNATRAEAAKMLTVTLRDVIQEQ